MPNRTSQHELRSRLRLLRKVGFVLNLSQEKEDFRLDAEHRMTYTSDAEWIRPKFSAFQNSTARNFILSTRSTSYLCTVQKIHTVQTLWPIELSVLCTIQHLQNQLRQTRFHRSAPWTRFFLKKEIKTLHLQHIQHQRRQHRM
jgi:hypothetical protein